MNYTQNLAVPAMLLTESLLT